MSANNQLHLGRLKKGYFLLEEDADEGYHYWVKDFKTLENALKYAQEYMENEEVEYGLTLSLWTKNPKL